MADARANVDRTAEAQLGRILYILAAARGEDGLAMEEVAERLGVPASVVADEVAQVQDRELYHGGGWVAEMVILLEPDRIAVPQQGDFRRPMKLTPREAGVLGLALRARAAEADAVYRQELLELATALEQALTRPRSRRRTSGVGLAWPSSPARRHGSPAEPEDGKPAPSLPDTLEIDPGSGAGRGVQLLLQQAVAERRPVRIRYLKPSDEVPGERVIHPYVLASAEGVWYAISFCPESDGVRLFRLDRMLEAELLDGRFEVVAGFDAADYTRGGRPFYSPEAVEAVVRYSPTVARWVLERYGSHATSGPDGSVLVRHPVADVDWLVRLVLGFGGEAVVEEPESLRQAVVAAAEQMSRAAGPVGERAHPAD